MAVISWFLPSPIYIVRHYIGAIARKCRHIPYNGLAASPPRLTHPQRRPITAGYDI